MDRQIAQKAEEVSAVLKQLAHPVRLKVLCGLLEKEKTVTELVEYVDASQSWVSQFLARMKLEGIVDSRKEANFVYYQISNAKVRDLMRAIYKIYCAVNKQKRSKS